MTLNNRWSKVVCAKDVYLPSVNHFRILNSNSKICSLGSYFTDRIEWKSNERKINIGEVEMINDKNRSEWVAFKSDNPFIQGYYLDSSRQGDLGAEHFF